MSGVAPWVRPSLVVVALAIACGPDIAGSSGSGTEGDSASADADSASSEVTSGSAGSSGTSEAGCVMSDLPPPFCHVAVPVAWKGVIGPPDAAGTRPIIVSPSSEGMDEIVVYDVATGAETVRLIEPSDLMLVPFVEQPFVFGDLDGDGLQDVALHTEYDDIPAFRLPSLDPFPLLTNPGADHDELIGPQRSPLYTLDVDLDGRDELLAHEGSYDGYGFEIWTLDGQWVQTGFVEVPWCMADSGIRLDVDLDGHLDLVTLGGENCPGRDTPYDPAYDHITVFHGRAGATAPEVVTVPAGIRGYTIHAGDYDGDAHQDLLVDGAGLDLGLIRGASGGGFHEGVSLSVQGEHEEKALLYTPAAGDFDGDGVSEFVISYRFVGLHVGRVVDATVELEPFDADITKFEPGDVNGDGITDVLAYGPEGAAVYMSAP